MNRPLDIPLSVIDEEDCNRSCNPSFDSVLQARLSRRTLLRGGFGTAATAVLGSFGLAACGGGDDGVADAPP
jgi:secreted PhoX family phosphatase